MDDVLAAIRVGDSEEDECVPVEWDEEAYEQSQIARGEDQVGSGCTTSAVWDSGDEEADADVSLTFCSHFS